MEYKPWWRVPRYKKRGRFKKRPAVLRADKNNTMSFYCPEAQNMSWREAREIVLPCGSKLGEKWGCLMKALLSQRVAMRHGDLELANIAAAKVHSIREDLGVRDGIHPAMEDRDPDHDQVFV